MLVYKPHVRDPRLSREQHRAVQLARYKKRKVLERERIRADREDYDAHDSLDGIVARLMRGQML